MKAITCTRVREMSSNIVLSTSTYFEKDNRRLCLACIEHAKQVYRVLPKMEAL